MRPIDADHLKRWILSRVFKTQLSVVDVIDQIDREDTIEPERKWIPVSEELPDMPIRVLVQLDNGWIITAYRQDNEWFSLPDFGEAIKDKWVEAWMPLPEPYRAERRTDEGKA